MALVNTERWLQFHTVALAIMGTWFLGWGQESWALPLALTVAGLASLLPTRYSRYLQVNRFVANIGALAAVAWSLRDFLRLDAEEQLLAIADMLIYLQMVLMFQQRTNRVYWQLLVLSVLQVVVAAALNLGPQFALLLAIYIAVSISTLVLLCLHSERPSASPAKSVADHVVAPSAPWRALLAAPQVVAPAEPEVNAQSLRRLFFRQVGLLTGATFLFTIVFFYATPRLGNDAWVGSRHGGLAHTGFSPELTLEDSGRIQQSDQLVMRVHFTRMTDGKPYPLIDEPYFHGVVLTEYRVGPEGARWVAPLTNRRRGQQVSRHIGQPSSALTLVKQDIALENASSPILFAVMPIHPLTETPDDLRHLRVSSRLVRVVNDEFASQREYRYKLGTMAFRNGRQLHAIPHVNANVTQWDAVVLADELQSLTEFDREQFPVVTALAEQILEEEGVTDASRFEQILALQRHFHKPGLYKYSLDLNFVRNRELDPVEDFLANHRTGHCEYFASALALMLRSRGIPSRIVNGYRGGEFNSLGNYYQVRQKHAHAWVEAYLSAEDTPEYELAGLPSAGGSWYRLDPTPAAFRPSTLTDPSLVARVGDAFDYVDLLWRDYVLGLNSSRQKDAFYDPVTNRTAGSIPSWADVGRVQSALRRLRADGWQSGGEQRSSRSPWSLGVACAVLVVILAASGRTLYAFWRDRKNWRWFLGRRGGAANRPTVEFYRRLEKLLSRLQLHRKPGQTPLEFARQAADALRGVIRDTPLAEDMADLPSLPTRIVAAYYQVRFGHAQLDSAEAAAIEQSLSRLVQATSGRRRK